MVSFRIDTEEKNIGWFRHAEIKHGRVAMAAVLGFIAQCTPIVSGEHTYAPYRGYVAGCTPQEQWDNIPLVGKLQIITLIGMLESYGEGAGSPEGYVHYTQGGKPRQLPPDPGPRVRPDCLQPLGPFRAPWRPQEPVRGIQGPPPSGRAPKRPLGHDWYHGLPRGLVRAGLRPFPGENPGLPPVHRRCHGAILQ